MAASTLFHVCARAFAAASVALTLATSSQADEQIEQVHVASHDVLLLDVSGSMDLWELQAAFQGVSSYYRSPAAQEQYSMGQCSANTVVFYAQQTMTVPTYILCDSASVDLFVKNSLESINLGLLRTMVGTGTNVTGALNAAKNVFEAEKDTLRITTSSHRVVLIGDQLGAERNATRMRGLALAKERGATVHAFAVGDQELAGVFNQFLVTPRNVEHEVKTLSGATHKRKVAAGLTSYAQTHKDIADKLQSLLALGGY